MPVVSEENYARILREAEEGARQVARRMSTEAKDLENGGFRQITQAELADREEVRVRRAVKYAEWRINGYETGECASPW